MLSVRKASELEERPPEQRWLIEGLWADQAVGIVGGEPKSFKSFFALEMAVAVASGKPCLRRFATKRQGKVLLFAAEDALSVVRDRIRRIALMSDLNIEELDIHVVTEAVVRLDQEEDQEKLKLTVEALQPALIILDPFVRLHRIDENNAGEVVPILSHLRQLQREHRCAVLLVHHARKRASNDRGGQALRGTSEFHAWGDSNAYLRWREEELTLTIEHRACAAPEPMVIELQEDGDKIGVNVVEKREDVEGSPTTRRKRKRKKKQGNAKRRVAELLKQAEEPLHQRDIREACGVRMQSVSEALKELVSEGQAERVADGYQLSKAREVNHELPVSVSRDATENGPGNSFSAEGTMRSEA